MGDSPIQARPERVSNLPNEPPLKEGNTSRSGEGSMKFLELMDLCTKLSAKVISLEDELASTKAVCNKALITLTKRLPKKFKKKEMIQISLDEEFAKSFYEEEQAQILQDEEYAKQFRIDLFSKAEVRKNMCTYLKNQRGYKMSGFKGMSYEEIRHIFEKVWDHNHAFVPKDSEIEKEVMKRSGFDLQKEPKKAEGSDQEEDEIKKYMQIVLVEEIAIDAIPLATKLLIIVDWNIISEGKISSYHIIRADGSLKRYTTMIHLLLNIDREDLENLWKLVKAKYGDTRPEEAYERVFWGDLKVMFEPDIEKKSHPLTPATITKMLDRKLQADHQNEMCYQLLKLMLKQQQKK
ncbi:hypothetical protein Tco_1505178 [Tanacetum coccineum]